MILHIIVASLDDAVTLAATAIIARPELLIVGHYSLGAALRTPCPSKVLNDHGVLDDIID